MLRVFLYELHVSNRSYKMTTATTLARDLAEEIRSQHFSEEFAKYTSDAHKSKWGLTIFVQDDTTRQDFGLEGSESHDPAVTTAGGGRIRVLNDVDDYDEWCRGRDCPGTGKDKPLETFDGQKYDGTDGFDDYTKVFTRRVRIRNIDVRKQEERLKAPFDGKSPVRFNRYNFENWSALRCIPPKDNNFTEVQLRAFNCGVQDAIDATGLTHLKRIEVTVSVSGLGVEDLEIQDVSYAVMPLTMPSGMD